MRNCRDVAVKIAVRNATTLCTKINSQTDTGDEVGKYLESFVSPKYRNVMTVSLDQDD
ncbi:hypothetical protein S2091_0966 [Solimicrobium silvestre]|uniref:Uncharacterized protein n=1 Tax=Solimicrobium silvestre TaxID=2099400 RepID=A0A2S9H2Y5_9BURK|nr:hypothetical protein S2091_0966 [Solimicrobium silvestre]